MIDYDQLKYEMREKMHVWDLGADWRNREDTLTEGRCSACLIEVKLFGAILFDVEGDAFHALLEKLNGEYGHALYRAAKIRCEAVDAVVMEP